MEADARHVGDDPTRLAIIAALLERRAISSMAATTRPAPIHRLICDGARVSRTRQYVVTVGGDSPRAVTLSSNDLSQSWSAETEGQQVQVRLAEVSPDGAVRVEIDGEIIN